MPPCQDCQEHSRLTIAVKHEELDEFQAGILKTHVTVTAVVFHSMRMVMLCFVALLIEKIWKIKNFLFHCNWMRMTFSIITTALIWRFIVLNNRDRSERCITFNWDPTDWAQGGWTDTFQLQDMRRLKEHTSDFGSSNHLQLPYTYSRQQLNIHNTKPSASLCWLVSPVPLVLWLQRPQNKAKLGLEIYQELQDFLQDFLPVNQVFTFTFSCAATALKQSVGIGLTLPN